MTRKLLILAGSTFVLAAIALLILGPTTTADARERAVGLRAGCQNPGYYTGSDSGGDFQAALEDAISEAEACAGCCDQLVDYEVVQTRGSRGGFIFTDVIEVTVEASW